MATRPDPMSMADAMQSSSLLMQLQFQLAQSRARMACIAPLLPPALRQQLRPSSVEDGVWFVLCPNAAALSKLRQLQPRLLAHLNEQGHRTKDLRFKVAAP